MTSTWPSVLLLVLGPFYVLAPIADIASYHSSGLPADHHAAFQKLGGISWTAAMSSAPGVAKYVTQLEYGYARHELTYAVLFPPIVAIPFRRRQPLGLVGLVGRGDREHRLLGHHRPLRLRPPAPEPHRRHRPARRAAHFRPYLLRKSNLPETPRE